MCRSHAIFDTLVKTSELADAVIAQAYGIAIADVAASHPPAGAQYRPSNQMSVIALGRLGMREFDLASDADLVFVLCDAEARKCVSGRASAERLIDLITAYTGGGVLFAVDTRLRPNGGDGPLVQTESAVKDYFARAAEAWEGITYMKSRAVAGEPRTRRTVSASVAGIDWRRYGQSGRSRTDLRQMRHAAGKRAGRGASAEGRPRRILRHRFHADVPAPQERRHIFQSR